MQNGSGNTLILGLVAILIIAGTTILLTRDTDVSSDEEEMHDLAMEDVMEDAMGDGKMDEGIGEQSGSFGGKVLAGEKAPYLSFNQTDFENALKSDKLIVLYFYANWCPTCKEEQVHTHAAFNQLKDENVIGFRVNYNDSDTDSFEKELARTHGVGYQHTKVFLKNGERILKSPESWDTERYLSEIAKAI